MIQESPPPPQGRWKEEGKACAAEKAGGTAVNICGAPWKHGMDRGMGNATGRILSRGADA